MWGESYFDAPETWNPTYKVPRNFFIAEGEKAATYAIGGMHSMRAMMKYKEVGAPIQTLGLTSDNLTDV